jgi:hypothetical protein
LIKIDAHCLTGKALKLTTKERMTRSIARARNRAVFLRADFSPFGTPSRVTRVLQELQDEGKLIRIGYGVYARARKSSITGNTVATRTLEEIASETLARLDAAPGPGRAAREYNAGSSTQIPMNIAFTTSRRVSRKLQLAGREVTYEKALR